MTLPVQKSGPDIILSANLGTYDVLVGPDGQGRLISSTSGSFTENGAFYGSGSLFLNRLDLFGAQTDSPVTLEYIPPTAFTEIAFDGVEAVALPNGNIAVTWVVRAQSFNSVQKQVKFGIFGPDGQVVTPSKVLETRAGPSPVVLDRPEIQVLSDGTIVVAYERDPGQPSQPEAAFVHLDAAGAQIATGTMTLGTRLEPSFAMAAAGTKLAVVHTTSPSTAEFLLVNPNGSAASVPVPIQPGFSGKKYQFDIAALKNGGFAVTWTTEPNPSGDREVMVQVFAANGAAVTAPATVPSSSVNFQEQPTVAALQDGGFVVAYTDTSLRPDDPSNQAVRAQAFDAAGNKVGPEILVNGKTAGAQFFPDLLTLPDGRVLALWKDATQFQTAPTDAYTTILDNRPQALPVSAGNDYVVGHGTGSSFANDTVYSAAGADTVFGAGGDDWLDAAAGNDVLFGGDGADVLFGGADSDWLVGDAGNDQLYGGDGVDMLQGGDGSDWLDAGSGPSNQLYGGVGADTMLAGAGDDWLDGGDGADQLYGGDGTNVLIGGGGRDWMVGGSGYDQLYGGDEADVMQGMGSGDWIDGGAGDDSLYGGEGVDTMQAGSGNDWIYGGVGNDLLYGGEGQNALFGDAGADWIVGGSAYDQLYGGAEADTLQGGGGGDWIVGGAGADLVIGGAGADTLVAYAGELQGDYYGDFATGEDLLSFQGFGSGTQLVYNGGGSYTLVYAGGAESFTVSADRVLVQGIDYGVI